MARMMKIPDANEIWEFAIDLLVTLAAFFFAVGVLVSPDAPAHTQPISLITVMGITLGVGKVMRVWVAFPKK